MLRPTKTVTFVSWVGLGLDRGLQYPQVPLVIRTMDTLMSMLRICSSYHAEFLRYIKAERLGRLLLNYSHTPRLFNKYVINRAAIEVSFLFLQQQFYSNKSNREGGKKPKRLFVAAVT